MLSVKERLPFLSLTLCQFKSSFRFSGSPEVSALVILPVTALRAPGSQPLKSVFCSPCPQNITIQQIFKCPNYVPGPGNLAVHRISPPWPQEPRFWKGDELGSVNQLRRAFSFRALHGPGRLSGPSIWLLTSLPACPSWDLRPATSSPTLYDHRPCLWSFCNADAK